MSQDYYSLLGVSKTASEDEIKKAFRKLAHQHHPDKEGGDETKFKEINQAYQVLSDPAKRKAYDQFGEAGVNGAAGGGPGGIHWEDIMRQAGGTGRQQGGVEFDLGDIFSEFFGGGQGNTARTRTRAAQQRAGADIQKDITISFQESAFGVKKTIELYKAVRCSRCQGNAAEPGTPLKTCDTCKGEGAVTRVQQSFFGAIRSQQVCSDCDGEGKSFETPCSTCHGQGTEKKSIQLEVQVPAGIDDGQTIRITGQGEMGKRGSVAGDLYIVVHVQSGGAWQRRGDDVVSTVAVPYSMLVLGGKVDVQTLDGPMTVKIPAGTSVGKVLRLRGKGMTRLHGNGRGDHLLEVSVHVPDRPDRKLKKLLQELADAGS